MLTYWLPMPQRQGTGVPKYESVKDLNGGILYINIDTNIEQCSKVWSKPAEKLQLFYICFFFVVFFLQEKYFSHLKFYKMSCLTRLSVTCWFFGIVCKTVYIYFIHKHCYKYTVAFKSRIETKGKKSFIAIHITSIAISVRSHTINFNPRLITFN